VSVGRALWPTVLAFLVSVMSIRGVWQLRGINIQYSETGHGSTGVRFYFRHLLGKWKQRNSQVAVTTVHEKLREPHAIFSFANGSKHRVSLKCLTPRQIEEVFDLYRDSESSNEHLRHGGPRVWTERRSIQGLWQPSIEGQLSTLKWFHKEGATMRLPKYSAQSLKLSCDSIRGQGRWGNEREYPKGWDRWHLNAILKHPLVNFQPSVDYKPVGKVAIVSK